MGNNKVIHRQHGPYPGGTVLAGGEGLNGSGREVTISLDLPEPQPVPKQEEWAPGRPYDGDVVIIGWPKGPVADGGGVPSGFFELGFEEEWLVFTTKSGAISMHYARRTEFDYPQLQRTTTAQGSVFGPSDVLAGIESASEDDLLDLFLAGYGVAIKREVDRDSGRAGVGNGRRSAAEGRFLHAVCGRP